ncbi:hypothetical protein COCMIDRAFT_91700 [Bipolaris oryzae ATCC 44560]|uniref:Uncharacterized protein n=1 Tax=Bipolaris oryzae ATCC 44560 TaxID=930090 RepID=W6ZA12_COCMI|nr:uncharacterized protein COCMIDRAFT_91700 [Bipolaris oryzae ATCC 44560]EUC46820.1 hypothetical protein COCMIDRAFT_91700 [Bipolaris oryzae ATCC 44560]
MSLPRPCPLTTTHRQTSSEDDVTADSDFSESDSDWGFDSDDDEDENGDVDEECFYINAIISVPGPYTLSWDCSSSLLWSKSLVQHGEFEAADAILLAFVVDVAMKLYIVDGINYSVLNILDTSQLVWTVLSIIHNSIYKRVSCCGWSKGDVIQTVESFFLAAAPGLHRIRERFDIAFLQKILDPYTKLLFAKKLILHENFTPNTGKIAKVYRWVYGEPPELVLFNDMEDGEPPSQRPINIRQWVFEYN